MKVYNLKDFKGGWFIGNFIPTLHSTNQFEISVKKYKSGDHDQKHLHKHAVEYTIIIEGVVKMNNTQYYADDIIEISKEEATDFTAITNATTCVVKIPCVIGDKYLI